MQPPDGQDPDDGEGREALAEALCALAEAHLHASDVDEAGQQVESLLQQALRLGASPEPLQVRRYGLGRPWRPEGRLRRPMEV